jgi:hypothetical protein
MNLIYKVLFFIILVFVSCNDNRKEGILLEIGKYVLTVSDYNYIKDKEPYKSLKNSELEYKLVEEGLILAYAMDSHYDTIGVLKKQLEYAERYYASKVEGYVWNKKVKPYFHISDEDLNNAYKKRNSQYTLEVLNFPSKRSIEKYLPNKEAKLTNTDFIRLREEVNTSKNLKFLNYLSSYPFYPLGVYTDKITSAKIGDIIGPLESLNGFYIIHVKAIKNNALDTYSQIQPILKQELYYALKDKYIWESQKEIVNETKPILNESALIELASKFNSKKNKFNSISRSLVLMKYNLNDTEQTYTVSDFQEFIQFQPVFIGSLDDSEDIKRMLKTFLIGKYLFEESRKLGIENDADFKSFKKYNQHKLFIKYYKQIHEVLENPVNIDNNYPIEINQIKRYIQN